MDVVQFNNKQYPEYQTNGNAARFIMPFANEVLKGKGLDIGCGKKEWAFPNAQPIDISFDDEYNAMNLPKPKVDYIFSSHCLEHLPDWVRVLDYWSSKLKYGGTLFLYLPHYSQEYWRPWIYKKHINILTPNFLKDYLIHNHYNKINVTGKDLYNSFAVIAEKGYRK